MVIRVNKLSWTGSLVITLEPPRFMSSRFVNVEIMPCRGHVMKPCQILYMMFHNFQKQELINIFLGIKLHSLRYHA